jgi:hypothetical protein
MEAENLKKVIYTNAIPQCPYCEKPTKRIGGSTFRTLMYYPPHYDENGVNTNPDRNTTKSHWKCTECNNDYLILGNDHDGYNYKLNIK